MSVFDKLLDSIKLNDDDYDEDEYNSKLYYDVSRRYNPEIRNDINEYYNPFGLNSDDDEDY